MFSVFLSSPFLNGINPIKEILVYHNLLFAHTFSSTCSFSD